MLPFFSFWNELLYPRLALSTRLPEGDKDLLPKEWGERGDLLSQVSGLKEDFLL